MKGFPACEIFTRLLLIWFCKWPRAIYEGHFTTSMTRLTCRPRSYRWIAVGEKNRCRIEFGHRVEASKVKNSRQVSPKGAFSAQGCNGVSVFLPTFRLRDTEFWEIRTIKRILYNNDKTRESLTYCRGIGAIMNIGNHEMARVNNFILFCHFQIVFSRWKKPKIATFWRHVIG